MFVARLNLTFQGYKRHKSVTITITTILLMDSKIDKLVYLDALLG